MRTATGLVVVRRQYKLQHLNPPLSRHCIFSLISDGGMATGLCLHGNTNTINQLPVLSWAFSILRIQNAQNILISMFTTDSSHAIRVYLPISVYSYSHILLQKVAVLIAGH